MRTISYKLDDLKKVVIPIGYEGENNHTRVIIDAGEVFKQYPEAAVALTVQPPKGTMYPAIVTRDGDSVTWDVKDSDCASNGNGEAQFTFTNGTVVVKSVVTKIKVQRSLHTEGPAPDPIQSWLDTASETLEEADQAIEAATDAAAAAEAAAEDLEALDDITKAALAGDVGKALSPKTVENGVVTEWQFVEPGAGTDDYADLDNKPSIAGVTLSGNKTLEDLGIAADDDLDNLADEVSDVKTAIEGVSNVVNKDAMLDNYSLAALNKGRSINPIVTFIDDDNNKAFSTFWLPIIEEKEIPVSMAVIVGQVGIGNSGTWDDIKNYHDNYGVEILSHSYYHHINASDYDSLTVDEISATDFGLAKRILEEHGYIADVLVYPGSATDNKKVRIAVTRDYVAGIDGGDALNTTPISHYSIKRYHYAYDDGQTPDIDLLKSYVDACVANNAWLIFESHSQYSSMTPETAEVICDLVDYIRSVGAEIVSVKDGFARFANIVDVEDGETRIGKFKLSPDGKIFNDTGINCGYSTEQIHNFYSGIQSYEDMAITRERIITDALLFPHNDSGILETIRYNDNMFQRFMPFHYQEIWVREVANNALPAEFTCLNPQSGAYDNRNGTASERKGNVYFDETNNRPIFCKKDGKRSIDQFTVTKGATSSGNIKISYAFGSKDVAVSAGDTAQDVANKIKNTSFTGHNIKQCLENPLVLYLTRLLTGSTGGASFTDTDSTGVTISVSRVVQGTGAEWVDATGNAL